MKFLTVFQFEFGNYIKNKTYIITTFFLGIVLAAILFLPRFFNVSDTSGTGSETTQEEMSGESGSAGVSDGDTDSGDVSEALAIYDAAGIWGDLSFLRAAYPGVEWIVCENTQDLEAYVENGMADAGFVINGELSYDCYLLNRGLTDSDSEVFSAVMLQAYQQRQYEEAGIDYNKVMEINSAVVESQEIILGKDTLSNYWYCYMLVIVIFMMIILYGTMIATSVTTEKSNRSIEVLVTSVDSSVLLFGKVIAGAVAGALQMVIVLGLALCSYQINRNVWGGMLDMLLDIPGEVLATFAFFGIGGYLFYAFLYGAMGALVSKTEDINKSSGGVQLAIMIVYFIVLAQLGNPDGMLMKVASFLPVSSYSAMFIRVAMGSVSMWEVIVSGVILIASIIGVGFLAAGIYRMGTLRYGNPIKFTKALKAFREK